MATLPTITGASPINASNNTYLNHTVDTNLDVQTSALGDTPTDFATMTSLQWQVEYSLQAARSDDTYGLQIRIMNGATVLAAADSGGGWVTVNSNVTSTTDTTSSLTAFAYVNTSANKATWDGADIEFRQNYSKTKGSDGTGVRIDYCRVEGVYVASAPSQNLTPTLFTNSQTFYGPTVSAIYDLTPSLFTNPQTLYAPTVAPAAIDLTVPLHTNSQTFYNPSISASSDLTIPLLANSQSFPAATVSAGPVDLDVPLFNNTQTFFSPSISQGAPQDLDAGLFTNSQNFFTLTITATYDLVVPLVDEGQTFFSPTISATSDITASLFTNAQGFFSPSVSASNTLSVPLLASSNLFFNATVDGGAVVTALAEHRGAMKGLKHGGDLVSQIREARHHG